MDDVQYGLAELVDASLARDEARFHIALGRVAESLIAGGMTPEAVWEWAARTSLVLGFPPRPHPVQ